MPNNNKPNILYKSKNYKETENNYEDVVLSKWCLTGVMLFKFCHNNSINKLTNGWKKTYIYKGERLYMDTIVCEPSLFIGDLQVGMRRRDTHAFNVTPYNNTRRHTLDILHNRTSDGLLYGWMDWSYVTEISDGILSCLTDVLLLWHIGYAKKQPLDQEYDH